MNELEAAKRKRLVKQIGTAVVFPIVIVGRWFYPLLGYFIPICMIQNGKVLAFSYQQSATSYQLSSHFPFFLLFIAQLYP
ncbi:MAG: hypothetical protein L0Y36_07945 [Planctomycetales bacterium]|nr:hypothetical protein [Planctomycetales bacterium]